MKSVKEEIKTQNDMLYIKKHNIRIEKWPKATESIEVSLLSIFFLKQVFYCLYCTKTRNGKVKGELGE